MGSVQRICRAHKLQPHRLRTFERSRGPRFEAKLTDIVGLYLDPPAHPVVLSIEEKSQIQALERCSTGAINRNRCAGWKSPSPVAAGTNWAFPR